jgi:hypothetical protein
MRSFFRHFSSTLFVRPREIFWGRSIRRIISKRNIEAPLKRFGFLDFWADGGLKIGETQYVPSTEPIRRFTAFLIKSVLRIIFLFLLARKTGECERNPIYDQTLLFKSESSFIH